jgi:hypothetical protein
MTIDTRETRRGGVRRGGGLVACAALLACAVLGVTLSGCGKPENDGEMSTTLTTPLPPYPAWSAGMIGQPLSAVVKGKANCIGVFDNISARPGEEVEGWAWDSAAKKGVQHVLIVDLSDRIIGAADGGRPRPDVPPAMPGVANKFVGWRGVVGATTGTALAVGLGAQGGQCSLSKSMKLDGGVY